MRLKNLKKPLCVASLLLFGFATQLSAVEVEPGRESSYFPKSKIRFFDSKLEEGGVLAGARGDLEHACILPHTLREHLEDGLTVARSGGCRAAFGHDRA